MKNKDKKVTILLSTYNGEKYLKEQLESILAQKNVQIDILVRDDGSSDNTISILEEYEKKGFLKWYSGENLKPAKSFMNLIFNAPDSDYYALCDQDDVWLEDKLKIAVDKLECFDMDKASLYYGVPRLVDDKLNEISTTVGINDCMSNFSEMLVESNATGCTFVFNKKMMYVLKQKIPSYIIMHDDWIYKVCLAVSGNIIFDNDVHILYRQHSNNVIGISSSFFHRLKMKFVNSKKNKNIRLNSINALYECYGELMSVENKKLCVMILNYKKNILSKFRVIFNRQIRTKYIYRNLYFEYLILFGLY